MDYFFMGFAAVILILNLVAFFGRVVPGTTIFDRLIGIGAIGTNTILFLLVLGILAGRLDKYIDVAIALAATGFLMLLALGRYFERKGDIDIND
jgi:multicomponent Na+:H+ antiporter subunit F